MYPWYVVVVLTVATALSYMDRQVINLLVEPIKGDLHLTDVQISLLQGLAFVTFYATMALPLGYLADRWPRRGLIAIGILLWSAATAACGLARSFWQLFAGRLSVGVGEASLLPAAYSLLPDYFGPAQLPRAYSVLQTGTTIGGGLAFAASGVVISIVGAWPPVRLPFTDALAPWQVAFLIAAVPGPLIALLMLTVREPTRRKNPLLHAQDHDAGFGRFLRERALFFIGHFGNTTCQAVLAYGIASWTPSFFIRSFSWSAPKIGVVFGCLIIFGGSFGNLISGYIAERWTRANKKGAPVRLNMWFIALFVPIATAFPLCPNPWIAVALLGTYTTLLGASAAMAPTVLQLATPHAYRGRISAIYLFVQTVLGVAGGPVIVASVTQYVFHDPHRLNQSIALVTAVFGPLAFTFTVLAYTQFVRIVRPAAETLEGPVRLG